MLRAQVSTHRCYVFLKFSADKLLGFNWSRTLFILAAKKNKRVVDYSIHSPFWNVLNTVVTIINCSLILAQIRPFHLIPTLPPPNSEVSLMNPSQIIFTLDPLEITRLKPRTFKDRLKNVPIWPPVRFKIAPKHQVTKFKKNYTPCNGFHSSGQYWQIFLSALRS